jgi:16S rRNA (adenine1518-N6/adenine1519-N6)-dimethyltransferase
LSTLLGASSSSAPPAVKPHRARRRYSQNFLHDPGTIARIIDAIGPQSTDRIVEVGPGSGALTAPLLARCDNVTAIEIDRDLVQMLSRRFESARLTLIGADALKVDWEGLARRSPLALRSAQREGGRGEGGLRIVGNLPYHISTPLLFAWLPIAADVSDQHLMLQKEVVDRIVARPGGSDYGRLSVMLQFRYRVERLFNVAAGAFTPAPKVQSSVLRLVPRPLDELAVADIRSFSRVVSAAFGQRRKMLRNALAAVLNETAIGEAGVDPSARAQTLDVAAFARLAIQLIEADLSAPMSRSLSRAVREG